MSDDRIDRLEPRVAVLEAKVSDIQQGMQKVHDDMALNNRLTADIKADTADLVRAGQAVAWLIKLFGWIGVIATGTAGIVYLAQRVGAVMHP